MKLKEFEAKKLLDNVGVLISNGQLISNPNEIQEFNDWLKKLPHKHKVVIAGNHECTMHHAADPNHVNLFMRPRTMRK